MMYLQTHYGAGSSAVILPNIKRDGCVVDAKLWNICNLNQIALVLDWLLMGSIICSLLMKYIYDISYIPC